MLILQVSENARDIRYAIYFFNQCVFSSQVKVKTQLQSSFKGELNVMCPEQISYFFPIIFMNSICSTY